MPEDNSIISKVMPYDKSAEGAVISAMLLDQEAIPKAIEIIKAEDFYMKEFKAVFIALVDLYNSGVSISLPVVRDRLIKMEVDESISNMSFLKDIYDSSITSVSIAEYSKIVKEKSVLRKIIRICEQASEKCYKGVEPLEDIIEFTESNVYDLIDNEGTGKYEDISDIVVRVINEIGDIAANKGKLTGISTGFNDLDRMLNGFQKADLVLLAARPSMGKTALALNFATHSVLKERRSVAIFSLEMSKEQLVNRLISIDGQVEGNNIRRGELSDEDWKRIVNSGTSIGGTNLIIDDTPGLSPSLLRSKCRKYKALHGLDMIIIDYLQLMTGDNKNGRRNDNRQQEISDISRALKLIARELNVPVIALSQLSRAVESRSDHHPQLSDLRESGAIEQDADVVMFLYREWVYDKEKGNKNAAEVLIAKQRRGPIGKVDLTWLEDYTKFVNTQIEIDEE